MEHYLGLHYQKQVIESGMERLVIIRPPFTKGCLKQMNRESLNLAAKRGNLAKSWQSSLAIYESFEPLQLTPVDSQEVTTSLFFEAKRWAIIAFAVNVLSVVTQFIRLFGRFGFVLLVLSLIFLAYSVWRFMTYRSPLRRLEVFGQSILKAMQDQGFLPQGSYQVHVEPLFEKDIIQTIGLKGGSTRDKSLFTQVINEFFGPVDNQRYLLYGEKKPSRLDTYFAVPSLFAAKKETAQAFVKSLVPYIGDYQLVYTRTPAGRKHLLKARVEALANQEERYQTKKKVKSALR